MSSKQPRRQRRERYYAPLSRRHKFLHAHLSKELREKYGIRSVRVCKGDTVKIMRGDYKGHEGVVLDVDMKECMITVDGVTVAKADGSEVPRPIDPSNVMITKLNMKDRARRLE